MAGKSVQLKDENETVPVIVEPRQLETVKPRQLETVKPRQLETVKPRQLETVKPRRTDDEAANEVNLFPDFDFLNVKRVKSNNFLIICIK